MVPGEPLKHLLVRGKLYDHLDQLRKLVRRALELRCKVAGVATGKEFTMA